MRVAILLCGQMRCFDRPDVLQSVRRFFGLFTAMGGEVDVFVSTWGVRGVSYNHGSPVGVGGGGGASNGVVSESDIHAAYPGLVRSVRIHDLDVWSAGIQGVHKQIYEEGFDWNGMKIKGTSIPQLFTLWDANQQRQEWLRGSVLAGADRKQHDLVIRCRPDVVFGERAFSMEWFTGTAAQPTVTGTISAINCPQTGTFWANRIYDIFFYGDARAMNCLCDAYNWVKELVEHSFENGLHRRDVCRLLFVQARFMHSLQVRDVDYDLCRVSR